LAIDFEKSLMREIVLFWCVLLPYERVGDGSNLGARGLGPL